MIRAIALDNVVDGRWIVAGLVLLAASRLFWPKAKMRVV